MVLRLAKSPGVPMPERIIRYKCFLWPECRIESPCYVPSDGLFKVVTSSNASVLRLV